MYIPQLESILSQSREIQQKLLASHSDGCLDVQEQQLLYMITPRIGDTRFSTIVVDYAHNLLTFHQIGSKEECIGESVLHALHKLGIEDFSPRQLSYHVKPSEREQK